MRVRVNFVRVDGRVGGISTVVQYKSTPMAEGISRDADVANAVLQSQIIVCKLVFQLCDMNREAKCLSENGTKFNQPAHQSR